MTAWAERVMLDEARLHRPPPAASIGDHKIPGDDLSIDRRLGDELIDAARAVVKARYIGEPRERSRTLRKSIDDLEALVGGR